MAFNSFLLIPDFNRHFVEAIQRMAHQEAWDVRNSLCDARAKFEFALHLVLLLASLAMWLERARARQTHDGVPNPCLRRALKLPGKCQNAERLA